MLNSNQQTFAALERYDPSTGLPIVEEEQNVVATKRRRGKKKTDADGSETEDDGISKYITCKTPGIAKKCFNMKKY